MASETGQRTEREYELGEDGWNELPPRVVIVTRHPDYSNEFVVCGGPVYLVDIDLGSGFDGEPDDEETARDFAEGAIGQAVWTGNVEAIDHTIDIVAVAVKEFISREQLLEMAAELVKQDGRGGPHPTPHHGECPGCDFCPGH